MGLKGYTSMLQYINYTAHTPRVHEQCLAGLGHLGAGWCTEMGPLVDILCECTYIAGRNPPHSPQHMNVHSGGMHPMQAPAQHGRSHEAALHVSHTHPRSHHLKHTPNTTQTMNRMHTATSSNHVAYRIRYFVYCM